MLTHAFAICHKTCTSYVRSRRRELGVGGRSGAGQRLCLTFFCGCHAQLVYDDQEFSWPAVYGKDLSCQVKQTKALLSVPVHFDAHNQFYFATNINEHIRPRFWYVVLANCEKVYGITYAIHFLNIQASAWQVCPVMLVLGGLHFACLMLSIMRPG